MRKSTLCRAFVAAVAGASSALAGAQLASAAFAGGFSAPLACIQDPVDPSVQYVVQKGGIIRTVVNGVVLGTDFLNITARINASGERGLLGLTFAPNYATTGHFYVNYISSTDLNTKIARFTRVSMNPPTADPNSELPIITVVQPANRSNHKAGTIQFGDDGFLYVSTGDGGSGNDPDQHGQNPNSLLGKMLRINPAIDDFPADPNRHYRIPSDNPFLDGVPITALGEIWAFGYRNPFKWSFDHLSRGGTGAMIVADVGQNAWEEIDYEPMGAGGRNYGWRIKEGFAFTGLGGNIAFPEFTDPKHVYAHGAGASITGGYVYRGFALGSEFRGRYFFGDYVQQRIWSLAVNVDGSGEATMTDLQEHTAALAPAGQVVSFDIDERGELYYTNIGAGTVRRIIRNGPIPEWPTGLSFFRGVHVSGNVASLRASDDNHLGGQPGLVLNSSEAPIQLIVDGLSPAVNPSALTFRLEARANVAGLIQTLSLFNYTTNAYEVVDTRAATTTDSAFTYVAGGTLSRFVHPATQQIRALISYRQNGPVPFFPYTVSIDQTLWTITP